VTDRTNERSFPFLHRHHFLLRRLHSLSGIVPIGIFLMVHLVTNASVLWGLIDGERAKLGHAGVATYQHEVNFIHSLPALLLIEVFGLWLPIAFHSVLGIAYAIGGQNLLARYDYGGNWRYVLQRFSGYVGVLFIFYHVATLRWHWDFLIPGGAKWDAQYAASTLAHALQGSPIGLTKLGVLVSLFYVIGVTLLVFHFANGLWTAAITWGLTISAAAQRRWGFVCGAVGITLAAAGWGSVIGFAFLDQSSAREVEQRLLTPEGTSTLHPTAVAPEIPAPATPLVDRSSQHP